MLKTITKSVSTSDSAPVSTPGFSYHIKRGRRKTLGLYVHEGQVEVRAPHFVSQADIHAWVEEKTPWILQRLQEHSIKATEKPDISQGGQVLFLGNPRKVELIHGTPAIFDRDDRIIIAATPRTNTNKLLEKWLRIEAERYILERSSELAELMREQHHITRISFRKTRSKWGHCTSKGVVQFNWLIIMAPPDVIDYLIIHEFSHLQHMNHSPAFWQRVTQFCPDYKTHRRWLKDNGHRLWL